ncbi:hypothetical protein ACA910_005616 [Epithemia clementina (nom. ined.)]
MPFEVDAGCPSEAIALLKKRLSGFETEQGRLSGLNYKPGPRDVVITTTPKAGTTWMQQICHQLRSGGGSSSTGDMSFIEISQVVPWLELAHDQGQNLQDAQPVVGGGGGGGSDTPSDELRFFKTHAWADHCPPFVRTIVVIRDPCDVLLSFYLFFEGWFFEPGTLSIDAFADEFWLARGVPENRMQNASYFVHLISWYKRRKDCNNDDDVLFVCFEDLKDDLEGQVKRVGDFLATLDPRYNHPKRIQVAVHLSTYEFMKEHADQFDEKLSKLARNEACGLPKDAGMGSSKIGNGSSGHGKLELSQELRQKIDEKWRKVVLPVTGCSSYQELRQKLAEECDKKSSI